MRVPVWAAIAVTLGGCIPLFPGDAGMSASGNVTDSAGKIYDVCRVELLAPDWRSLLSRDKGWFGADHRVTSGNFGASFSISPQQKEAVIEVSCRGAKNSYRSPVFALAKSRDIQLGIVVLERASAMSFQEALCSRDVGLAKQALATGQDPNVVFTDGFGKGHTPLTLALTPRDCQAPASLELVALLVDHGADVNKKSATRPEVTPLFEAVGGANVPAVEFLLRKGADVNARNGIENTPLLDVAENRSEHAYAMAEILLKAGADPHAKSFSGQTAEASAERWGQQNVADLIRRAQQRR